jgi:hypothetical protein
LELVEQELRLTLAHKLDLERQVQFLDSLITQDRATTKALVEVIRELSTQASATTQRSFDTILEVLERGFTADDKETILDALTDIQKQNKPLFIKLSEFIVKSGVSGAIGNTFYDIIKTLKSLVPP